MKHPIWIGRVSAVRDILAAGGGIAGVAAKFNVNPKTAAAALHSLRKAGYDLKPRIKGDRRDYPLDDALPPGCPLSWGAISDQPWPTHSPAR